jgi:hypothetical protein
MLMSEPSFMDKPIDELGVSDECLRHLKSTGITKIRELVEGLEGGIGITDPLSPGVLRCFDEIIIQLKAKGCWPDSLD